MAIALQEGIVSNCSDRLSLSQFFEVLKIAQEKYGLKPKEKPLDEPKGWALSISITKMAERYGLMNCPQCNNPFKFIESHGFFGCDVCRYRGGLKKFAELIATHKSEVKN